MQYIGIQAHYVVVVFLINKGIVGCRTCGNNFNDIALDKPLCCFRVFNLFADSYFIACFYQPVGIAVERVIRKTGQRHVFGASVIA